MYAMYVCMFACVYGQDQSLVNWLWSVRQDKYFLNNLINYPNKLLKLVILSNFTDQKTKLYIVK